MALSLPRLAPSEAGPGLAPEVSAAVCPSYCRLVPLINCATSFLAGVVVFSILGYMSHLTGRPVDEVRCAPSRCTIVQSPGHTLVASHSTVVLPPGHTLVGSPCSVVQPLTVHILVPGPLSFFVVHEPHRWHLTRVVSCRSHDRLPQVAQGGTGLAFVVYPEALSRMPGAPLFSHPAPLGDVPPLSPLTVV